MTKQVLDVGARLADETSLLLEQLAYSALNKTTPQRYRPSAADSTATPRVTAPIYVVETT